MKIILLLISLSASLLVHAQVSITVDNNAGSLITLLSSDQLNTVTNLTITGTLDANDIAVINNIMPALTTLDISNTTLSPCVVPAVDNFEADWFPGPSLSRNSLNYGGLNKPLLTSVMLPSTLRVLGSSAFENSGLTTITIPTSVTSIGWSAFARSPLSAITIPSSVSYMDQWIFDGCSELKEAVIEAALTSIPRGTFAGCTSLSSVNIPSTVISIGMSAFINCRSLNTIVLPPSVNLIEMTAFYGCSGLTSIYSNNPVPPQAQSSCFGGVDKVNCILHVPSGSAELYKAAPEWQAFTNIVEGPGLSLSSNAATALANNTNMPGTGTITASTPGIDSQTFAFTQNGLFVGLEEVQAEAQIKYYPNPFMREMAIEIANTGHKKISVDIYSLTGQRLRSLANQRNDEKISLVWNGTNQEGQMVPYGMYILKINNEAKQVVFKGR
ncbi:MAG: leucine-rich repeat domain-containing protein [Candidatus Saccharibacteria bacterium]